MIKIRLFLGVVVLLGIISFFGLKSPKRAEAQTSSFKFAVYSDGQYSYDSTGATFQRSVDALKNKVPNAERAFLFGLGDFTTSGLVTDTVADHLDWTEWKTAMDSLVTSWTQTNPPQFVGTWGDHDTDRNNSNWLSLWTGYMSAQKSLTAYSEFPSSANGLYGSMKYQNALFLWLTSAEPTEETLITSKTSANFFTTEETYISNILTKANTDSAVKWKFVFYHNPAEACGIGTKIDNERTKGWLNNYFRTYGVDMIFNGHTHSYVRTCPIISITAGLNGATNCENFADNQVGDPQGVIEIMSTPFTAAPSPIATCPALRKAKSTRNFVEMDIAGDILNLKTWDIDNQSTLPMDSLTINKSAPAPQPILLVKSSDKTSTISGQNITYTINYTNPNSTYQNVTISDPVSQLTNFVSATGGGSFSNNTVTWNLGSLQPGNDSVSFTVKVK